MPGSDELEHRIIQPQVVNVTTPVNVSPPDKFPFSSPGTWTSWRKSFERYMSVSGQLSKPEEEKINILVYIMGEESEEILLQFPEQPKSYAEALDNFENYFIPRRNIIFERFKFNSTIQKPEEPIDSFITNLHSLAEHCNYYGTLKEELIRDRIVVGMLDSKTSERLQLKEHLDLKECILMAKQAELQASQSRELSGGSSRQVSQVQFSSQSTRSESPMAPRPFGQTGSNRDQGRGKSNIRSGNSGSRDKCGFCGLQPHARNQCPAGKSICRKCQKLGHWAIVCRSTTKVRLIHSNSLSQGLNLEQLELEFNSLDNSNHSQESNTFLGSITINHVDSKEWVALVFVSRINKNVEFLIDSGADITCAPYALFNKFLKNLQVSDKIITGPSGIKLKVLGILPIRLSFQGQHFDTDIYIIDKLTKPILGRTAIIKLNMLSHIKKQIFSIQQNNLSVSFKDNVKQRFPRIFKDVGTFKTNMCIKLAEGIQPYVQSVRRVVPIPLLKPLKEELKRLQHLDIIEPIESPTDWGENGVSIDFNGGNVTYIPIKVAAELSPLQRSFSKEDWVLLDAMGTLPQCSGKFLTMHKRRRKRLSTRALSQDQAILDDIHHGLVQRILDRCSAWAFNAFTLETVAGGRSLPVLCVHLFHWYGLLEHFQLDVVRVWKLFTLIEEGYHSTNPYHNSIHATDVTQAMHCFLQEEQIRRHVTPLEIMASLIGAVAHDLDHPGVNQHFLITTSNHLAILYQNMSVLENHHWRSAVGCLLESGVAEQLLPYRGELEQQIRDLILATDINRQQEFLTKFRKHIDDNTLDLRLAENRQFILQIALKCADISNPTRPWDISHKWSIKVCDEFFRQGEFERQLGLPVTSICDQQSTSVAKIQVGFFRFVVTPLFSEWHRFMHSALSTHMIEMLDSNRRRWEEQEHVEQAEETQTELSDAEPEISEEEEPTKRSSEMSTSIHDFIPPPPPTKDIRRQSLAVPTLESLGVRRHSVPVHMEIPTSTSGGSPQRHQTILPRTIYRRESLPTTTILKNAQGRSPVSPQTESRASSGLREEDELLHYGSQSSVISSSGSPYHSSEEHERPLSAENLLPETSIASMSSSAAIRHLTSVLQSAAERAMQATSSATTKCLTRQQTFPPPQPYMRVRYMSATVEMSTCPEGDSRSNSSRSSNENISRGDNTQQATAQQQPSNYTIPAIAVLSPNNSRPPDLLLPGECKTTYSNNNKRETDASGNEKEKEKRLKLSESSGPFCEKENMDPRKLQTTSMARRGSAPVFLHVSKTDEFVSSAGGGGLSQSEVQALRRGSVPIEIAHHFRSFDEDNGNEQQSSHIINITPVETNRTFWQYQRRGSAPVDLPPSGMASRYEFTRHTSLNGKATRGRGKKPLRRRSSGGPETVSGGGGGGEVMGGGSDVLARFCAQLHRRTTSSESPDALLARRRGSLPLEVLTVGHSVF